MSRTKRNKPKNGEFKKLRGSKKQRNKKQRQTKVDLQKFIGLTNIKEDWVDLRTMENYAQQGRIESTRKYRKDTYSTSGNARVDLCLLDPERKERIKAHRKRIQKRLKKWQRV